MDTYRVYFEDTDSTVGAHYNCIVHAEGIIPAIRKAIELDVLRWEVVKVEKVN